MATLRQFCKGETIKITVTPDADTTMTSPVMFVYPDNLVLNSEAAGSDKIIRVPTTGTQTAEGDGTFIFTIPSTITRSDNMPAGDYTIELKYGSTEISIVKQNRAFTLVDSGYNTKETNL